MSGSADKIRGDDVYLEIYTGAAWVKPGGQEDTTLTRNKDTVETTDKDSDGWKENIDGFKGWEVSCPMFFEEADSGQVAIQQAFENNDRLQIRVFDGTSYHTGYSRVTSYEMAAPATDAVKISCSFTGDGALAES